VFLGAVTDSPFYVSSDAVALAAGNINSCTQLSIISSNTTSFFQMLNGMCTDSLLFSTTSLYGPHYVNETCSDVSLANVRFLCSFSTLQVTVVLLSTSMIFGVGFHVNVVTFLSLFVSDWNR
jgi:hypothetical protein